MLEDMDDVEASCILYVKVVTFDRLEQCKVCVLTTTTIGMVILTIQHDMMFSLSFKPDCWDFLRHTSPDVHSLEELRVHY